MATKTQCIPVNLEEEIKKVLKILDKKYFTPPSEAPERSHDLLKIMGQLMVSGISYEQLELNNAINALLRNGEIGVLFKFEGQSCSPLFFLWDSRGV